jgi:glycosyltransferase involved in cell wall biosynthesis
VLSLLISVFYFCSLFSVLGTMDKLISTIFVAPAGSLLPSGGGVQVCSQEYLRTLKAAGFSVQIVPFDIDCRVTTRLWNRISPRVTPRRQPSRLVKDVEAAIAKSAAQFVFFNTILFSKLSRHLRRRFPTVRQVFLSPGVESIDFCIGQQIRRQTGAEDCLRPRAERMLGEELLEEAGQRRWIDAVLTLSPFEVEVEKWLGSKAVQWIPRTVLEPKLDLKPVTGRVGCVSTLDHPPNHDGLERLFEALAKTGDRTLHFRLVGRPSETGRKLAQKFPFVEYAGALDDAALKMEAATWCCFVHPLFVYAKGCSTKLASGLGWGLPIATTEYGARGYQWDVSILPLARTPGELALTVLERSRVEGFHSFQQQTFGIVAQTPSLETVAQKVRQFLMGIN